jgi:hypothetical protein
LGYIGDGVLLALFFIPVFYLMQTAATHILSPVFDFGPWEDPSIARFFLKFIVSPIALLPISEYLLLLPAVAVGKHLTFRNSKRFWQGNFLRLWAVYVLSSAPEYIVNGLVPLLGVGADGTVSWAVAGVFALINNISLLLFFAINVGALSLAYKVLVEWRSDPPPDQAFVQP